VSCKVSPYLPGRQAKQLVLDETNTPRLRKYPKGQSLHDNFPGSDWYCPGLHLEQVEEEAAVLIHPDGHGRHKMELPVFVLNVPGLQ